MGAYDSELCVVRMRSEITLLNVFVFVVPSLPPQNVTVYNLSYDSFRLNWDPVPQEFANGRIQVYRVRVWKLSQWMSLGPNITTVSNRNTSALIGGLKADTRYKVNVSAFTAAGEGNSTALSVTTYKGENQYFHFA